MRDDERTEFEVEEIQDCTTDPKTGVIEYLVKWVGYSLRFCTWEPASNLENAQLAILEYEWRFPERFPRSQLYRPLPKPTPADRLPLSELRSHLLTAAAASSAPVSGYRPGSLSPTKGTTTTTTTNGNGNGSPNLNLNPSGAPNGSGALERASAKPTLRGDALMRKFLRIVGKNYKWKGRLLDLALLFRLVLRATSDARRFQLFSDEMEKPSRGTKRKHEPSAAAAANDGNTNGTECKGETTKEVDTDVCEPPAKREATSYGLRAATHRPVALYKPAVRKSVPRPERPVPLPCRPMPTPKPPRNLSKISLRKQKENAKHTLEEFERFINESNKRINPSAAKTTLENNVDLEVLPAGDFQ